MAIDQAVRPMICREHYLIWYNIAFLSKIAKKANLGLLNLKPKNQNSFRTDLYFFPIAS